MIDISTIEENEIYRWIALIATTCWILTFPFKTVKFVKSIKRFNQNTVKDIAIISMIILIGLLLPLLVIFSTSFSDGWLLSILRVLSFISLFEFLGFVFITFYLGNDIRKMKMPKL